MSKTVILGGGLGGLSFAHYYLKKFPTNTVTILEASDRIGGWIKSINKDGIIIEQGPRSIRPRSLPGINTLQLVDELNLSDQIISISANHPAALNRMIYANGQLHSLPSKFLSIFKRHPPFSEPFYKYLLKFVLSRRKPMPTNDESLYSFVKRKFGVDIADYAISPLVCGICAGDAKEISVRFLMDSLFEKDQQYENTLTGLISLIFSSSGKNVLSTDLYERAKKEKWNIYSFKEGIEVLPKTLARTLKQTQKCDIELSKQVEKLHFSKDGAHLFLKDGTEIKTENLVSSIPAYKLGEMVQNQYPILGNLLSNISCVDVAVVNLEYDKKIPIKSGFGFLVPPKEQLPILGVIFDSCCFERSPNEFENKTLLTAMVGGRWYNKYFTEKDKEQDILNVVLENLEKTLNVKENPDYYKVSILKNCIPQYNVGHKSRVQEILHFIKKNKLCLNLCGNSYFGVGINDVILSAKLAAEQTKV